MVTSAKKAVGLGLLIALVATAGVPVALADTIYTTEASFLAQLAPDHYLNEFSDLSGSAQFLGYGPLHYAGTFGYGYDITSPGGGLYAVPAGDGAISTLNAQDSLVFTFSGSPVYAVGGAFFATDYDGFFTKFEITVTLADETTNTLTPETIEGAFLGFTSTQSIASLTIKANNVGGSEFYPTADHLYVGAAVPAPTGIIALLGLGATGLARLGWNRRRRAV